MFTNRPFSHTSDCAGTLTNTVEMFDVINNESKLGRFKEQASFHELSSDIRETVLAAPKWLPFASEKYNTSKDIKDFVITSVVIMPSDLPNRNGVAFPHTELSSWCPDAGQLMYKTWTGKPTFVEHNNKDHTQAKGVILSSTYRPMRGVQGDLWKVICLAAFDRTRDPILANEMLTNDVNNFSMGAYCSDYRCSITGNLFSKGTAENYTKLGRPSFQIVGGRLAYLDAVDPLGFELSYVKRPAFASASTGNKFMWGN